MTTLIEDYALISNCCTAALVGRNGSIDWLCLPRFDSGACFTALLGEPEHGRWLIRPAADVKQTRRSYRDGTLILETEFETSEGAVKLIDFMSMTDQYTEVVRMVEGVSGQVKLNMDLVIRFDYGLIVPWVWQTEHCWQATAGPDTVELRTDIPTSRETASIKAEFTVTKGQRKSFVLTYHASHHASSPATNPEQTLDQTERAWHTWSDRCTYDGHWKDQVLRSLLTLKALTYKPTGGIVAAPTTSLPEQPGGVRNWDYRFCWVRDATFTLNALLAANYQDEAVGWREWLLRAVAGDPDDLQIMYGITGVRRLEEMELDWLPGYGGATPVRAGNAASKQFQLDVYGEIMDTMHLARCAGLHPGPHAWEIQKALLGFLETNWQNPDEGIWEIRGPRRQFTHSKVMVWVAFDRAIKDAQRFGLDGPVPHWRDLRDTIHAHICDKGFDAQRNTFVQYFGSSELDASLLLIPLVGFLAPDDPRVSGTVEAIERELMPDGLVLRYASETKIDNLPAGEGTFLPCSFWMADNLALIGRHKEAEALFERLLALRNDVGLLAEEYDPASKHMRGNFPQALTHMALINTALLLTRLKNKPSGHSHDGDRPVAVARTKG
ncbi:glycoside hydrolase family 15 protein [Allopusillimonas ginsengisoli]|uniref:glycoside hydrolase family 15 protein n=1 Tax=Allopusillimonas ginsengisoli TaxID=453575 RepID=UPI0010C1A638|nr:glycoside hydrolase family 15 protein [Allopusillimonas ginsengisoli]